MKVFLNVSIIVVMFCTSVVMGLPVGESADSGEKSEIPLQTNSYRTTIGLTVAAFVLGMLTPTVFSRWRSRNAAKVGKTRGLAEQLHSTLNSLGEAVLSTDCEGRITWMNRTAELLTGWGNAEAEGSPYEDIFTVVDSPEAAAANSLVGQVLANGKAAAPADIVLIARDGSRRHVTANAAPVRDDAGNPAGTIVLFRDTSDECNRHKEFESLLANKEALNTELQDLLLQHELLLDIMPIYVYAEDANDEFRHVFCNRICTQLWGRPIEEILGKNDAELFGDSEEIRRFQETDAGVVASDELHESIQAFTGADGKRRIGRFFRKGIEFSDGRRWMFGLVVDITEEYEQRARLATSVELFEYASDLTKSAYFRFDPETREMSGAKLLDQLWPIKDGKALSNEEVVYSEDLPNFSFMGDNLFAGQSETATVDYRSEYFGEMRYYRLKVGLSRDPFQKTAVIGVVQDTTEFTQNMMKLQESMALQDLIINSLPIIFFAKDANDGFKYVMINQAFSKFMNKPPEEVLGKTGADLKLSYTMTDEEIMAMPDGVDFEEKQPAPDGTTRTFRMIQKPFIDTAGANGKRLLLGVASDVTELSEMNASQQTLNFCLSGLLSGEKMFDPEAVLKAIGQRLNASGCFLLRFDYENRTAYPDAEWQAVRDPASSLMVAPVPFREQDAWFRFINNNEIIFAPDVESPETIARFGLWPEENRRLKVKSLYSMLILVEGKPWGNFGVGYHAKHVLSEYETEFFKSAGTLIGLILQRKQYQEQVYSSLQEAQNANKAKSYFLASMSHEIRTPLNAVIGFAELLKYGSLPIEVEKDYLGAISSAGNTLLALINDVLDLSKLEAGQMQFNPSEVNFPELVAEVGTIFHQKYTEKNLNFAIDIPQLPLVWLDKLRIRQILFNLIGNAVKFTDRGEIRVTAAFVRESAESGTLTFSVVDTGIGISKDDQKRLFQMFVQSKALDGTQVANSGSGLGLAIVYRMLERMDGAIELESEPGKGSSFTVTIRNLNFKDVTNSENGKKQPAITPPEIPLHGSALLVDDIPMNLKVMSAMLGKIGISQIATAASAEEALQVLESASFDFMLIDLWMPGMNGLELAAQIRRDPRFDGVRLALVTADAETRARSETALFDAVITKPITLEKLRNFLASSTVYAITHRTF